MRRGPVSRAPPIEIGNAATHRYLYGNPVLEMQSDLSTLNALIETETEPINPRALFNLNKQRYSEVTNLPVPEPRTTSRLGPVTEERSDAFITPAGEALPPPAVVAPATQLLTPTATGRTVSPILTPLPPSITTKQVINVTPFPTAQPVSPRAPVARSVSPRAPVARSVSPRAPVVPITQAAAPTIAPVVGAPPIPTSTVTRPTTPRAPVVPITQAAAPTIAPPIPAPTVTRPTTPRAPVVPTTQVRAPVVPTTQVRAPVVPTTQVRAPVVPIGAPPIPTPTTARPVAPRVPVSQPVAPARVSIAPTPAPTGRGPRPPTMRETRAEPVVRAPTIVRPAEDIRELTPLGAKLSPVRSIKVTQLRPNIPQLGERIERRKGTATLIPTEPVPVSLPRGGLGIAAPVEPESLATQPRPLPVSIREQPTYQILAEIDPTMLTEERVGSRKKGYSASQLADIAVSLGLKKSGSKKELIERIQQARREAGLI